MKIRDRKIISPEGVTSFLSSVTAILIGLLFGLILLIIFNPAKAFYGFSQILFSGVSSLSRISKVLYQAAPLIMTGLAVGFAFKTGLFNIGASGQYLMGAFFALVTGIVLKQPWWIAMLASVLGGAIWGAMPGIFNAFFNVNEVITSIMFNWIGLFAVNLSIGNIPSILANYYGASNPDRTANIAAANPSAIIPKLGLDKIFGASYINISIFLASIIAIIAYVILNKTIFGYELKACGYNRNASIYAGINAKRNIVLSMLIAGAFAGVGGAIYYLSGNAQYTIEKALLPMGFNGIPVALLANSNPLGIIASALFISYIQVGGEAMQPEFAKESVDIIISIIIYLSAFSLVLKEFIMKLLYKRKNISNLDFDNTDDTDTAYNGGVKQ
ncbi:MAG: ABC transporter permease [Eubacteriales bacterium]|nr:ABC transporter permease [Eubacteriales bacterium]